MPTKTAKTTKKTISTLRKLESNGDTLRELAYFGNNHRLTSFLENNVVNIDSFSLSNRSQGDTALMIAASRGHIDVVRTLLKHGANPNLLNHDKASPLMAAALMGHEEIVIMLLKAGANIDTAHKYGDTALTSATLGRHKNIVKILLEAGANKDLVNNDGETALEIAKQLEDDDIVTIIEKQKVYGRFVLAFRNLEGHITTKRKRISDDWKETSAFKTNTGELIEMQEHHIIEPHIENGKAYFHLIDTRNLKEDATKEEYEEIFEGTVINMLEDHQGVLHSPYGAVSSTWKEVQLFETTTGEIIEITPEHNVEPYINKNGEQVYILKTPANIDNLKKAENTEGLLESFDGFYNADEMPQGIFDHNGRYNIDDRLNPQERAAAQEWIAQQGAEEEEDFSMEVNIPPAHPVGTPTIGNPSPFSEEEMGSDY